jgi:hypothetical protein
MFSASVIDSNVKFAIPPAYIAIDVFTDTMVDAMAMDETL